jgi:hypothetical protein
MSEPVQLARNAREHLAAALNALQTSDVPDELVDAAEPVAQAMGVLHRIERTNGENLEGRQDALDAVRAALNRVQQVDSPHPAVEKVMESIAASLSKVHALVRYTRPAPAPVAQTPAQVVAAPVVQPVPVVQPTPIARAAVVAPVAPAAPAPPAVRAAPEPVATLPIANQTLPIVDAVTASPVYAPRPERRETPPVLAAVPPQAQPAQPAEPARPASQPARPAVASVASGSKIDVELGTHSASNFYKGLGGNDVIEHGGIFVATYKALKINSTVTLRVLLPGDYEFTATAVVQWTREAGTSEPGFGARFTQISAEGRQLVYRYTRNREPMFYDDL